MRRALIIMGTLLAGLVACGVPAQAVIVEPFTLRYDRAIYGDFLTIGNAVMQCPTSPPATAAQCQGAQAGTNNLNNNAFVMSPANSDALPGAFDSSSGLFTIPAGATIVYARLFWGGHNGLHRIGANLTRMCETGATAVPSAGDPLTTPVLLRVAGGTTSTISPQVSHDDPLSLGGPHFYTAEAEVTSAFAGVTGGAAATVAVGNVWAATGNGCTAGWSLTVVWAFPSLNPAAPVKRHVYLWGGHVRQGSTDPATTITVDGFIRAPGTERTRVSLTAYEGDRGTSGDRFLVNGANIAEPTGTGPQPANNFFISASDGALNPQRINNLSIDAKDFSLPLGTIPVGATSASLTFATNGDTYVPQQLALSVPVPELHITKTAAVTSARPGDTIAYTLTVTNISPVPFPDAVITDEIEGMGQVFSWTGDLAPQQTVVLTYSVTAPANGPVVNAVRALESNCDPDHHDSECSVTIPIILPSPPLPVTGSGLWTVGIGLILVGIGVRLVVRR